MNGTIISHIPFIKPKEKSYGSGKPAFLGKGKSRLLFIAGAAVLLIAVVAGVLPRVSQRARATADTNQLAVPAVTVVSPTVGAPQDGLMLPAEIKPVAPPPAARKSPCSREGALSAAQTDFSA